MTFTAMRRADASLRSNAAASILPFVPKVLSDCLVACCESQPVYTLYPYSFIRRLVFFYPRLR